MDLDKTKALQSWQPPHQVNDLQHLLGFANYCWTFIPQFTALTAPLTNLLWKGVKFMWGPAEQEAFTALKAAFTIEPILHHPNLSQPFVVEIEASDIAVRAVLLQASTFTG